MTGGPALVRYGDHQSQFVEVWRPGGIGPHPVAVLLHGGYWRDRYDLHLMDGLAAHLCDRGWVAANVEYRRVGADGGGWPATFDDVTAALGAVAARPEVDAGRLVCIGHSAGGHLALFAAWEGDVAAVVALAPVSDLREASRRGLSDHAVHGLLGGSPAQHPDRYAMTNPMVHLPLGVRTLVVHGTDDINVPIDLSDAYVEAARAAGDDVTYHRLDGVDHFAVIDPTSPAWAGVASWMGSST
jgi:acetyl esterase/lipase